MQAEECQICCSYVHIGQDPIVGTNQEKTNFWLRIAAHFMMDTPRPLENHASKALESKFGLIKTDVMKFQGLYE
jgi:hypothetical protein